MGPKTSATLVSISKGGYPGNSESVHIFKKSPTVQMRPLHGNLKVYIG